MVRSAASCASRAVAAMRPPHPLPFVRDAVLRQAPQDEVGVRREPIRWRLVLVFDVAEFDAGSPLARIIEIELAAREKDQIAVKVLRNTGFVGASECIMLLAVTRGKPARQL